MTNLVQSRKLSEHKQFFRPWRTELLTVSKEKI